MQVTRCNGVMPAKASLDVIAGTPSPLLRHCTGCRAFVRVVKPHKPCARPFSGSAQQGKASRRALNLSQQHQQKLSLWTSCLKWQRELPKLVQQ